MLERTSDTKDNGLPTGEAVAANGHAALEQRVRRLEDAVAALQDTGSLEARIAERVTGRLERSTGSPRGSLKEWTGAGRKLVPVTWQDTSQQTEELGYGVAVSPPGAWRGLWVIFEAYAEARTMVRMFFDRRYQPTWLARVVPILLLIAIATSWYWLPGTSIPLLGTLLDKTTDLILAFLAFKILAWEARRYRAVLAGQGFAPR
jgi:hypothetical protein